MIQGSTHEFPMYRLVRSNWAPGFDELEPFAVVLTVERPTNEEPDDLDLTWVVKALAHNCKMESIEEAEAQTYIHFGVDSVTGMKELEQYLKARGAVPMR